jgi:hypothetical protein
VGLPESVARYLERLDHYDADEVAAAVWWTAISRLELAVQEARQGLDGRWRSYPRGELRRLRRNVAGAFALARFAVELDEEREREFAEVVARQARTAARRRKGSR